MNPTVLEAAFAVAVAPTLTAITRLTGADWRTVETDEPCLVAAVENAERVGGNLWKATVRLRVEFPALLNGADALADFEAAGEAVRAWLANPANVNGLTVTSGRIAGSHVSSTDLLAPQDNRLMAEFAVVVGWDGTL